MKPIKKYLMIPLPDSTCGKVLRINKYSVIFTAYQMFFINNVSWREKFKLKAIQL
jgi:hypothetical protein